MPTNLYLSALNRPNGQDYQRSSIRSILLALDIEDGCRHSLPAFTQRINKKLHVVLETVLKQSSSIINYVFNDFASQMEKLWQKVKEKNQFYRNNN